MLHSTTSYSLGQSIKGSVYALEKKKIKSSINMDAKNVCTRQSNKTISVHNARRDGRFSLQNVRRALFQGHLADEALANGGELGPGP